MEAQVAHITPRQSIQTIVSPRGEWGLAECRDPFFVVHTRERNTNDSQQLAVLPTEKSSYPSTAGTTEEGKCPNSRKILEMARGEVIDLQLGGA